MSVKLRFLGTGTSQGVPIIGCGCEVCKSVDPRDRRFRASALVETGGVRILIDAGPDFRMQMLAAGVGHLDAILLTHNHKDHTGGLDDVRSLNYIDRRVVPIYCEKDVVTTLRKEYDYAFADHKYPGAPEWQVRLIDERPFTVPSTAGAPELVWVHDKGYFLRGEDGTLVPSDTSIREASHSPTGPGEVHVIPIRGFHSAMPVLGFRFGDIAYITDMSTLPEEELGKLRGLEHVTLNTVGYKPHHSHFSLDQALELAGRIGAKNTWLTHLSHTFPPHEEFCALLERRCSEMGVTSRVLPAYDGLEITDK